MSLCGVYSLFPPFLFYFFVCLCSLSDFPLLFFVFCSRFLYAFLLSSLPFYPPYSLCPFTLLSFITIYFFPFLFMVISFTLYALFLSFPLCPSDSPAILICFVFVFQSCKKDYDSFFFFTFLFLFLPLFFFLFLSLPFFFYLSYFLRIFSTRFFGREDS